MSYSSLKTVTGIGLLVGMLVIMACRYYKPVKINTNTAEEKVATINKHMNVRKYFILRHTSGNYTMSDIRVDERGGKLYFKPSPLPVEHTYYASNTTTYKYLTIPKEKGGSAVLNEVHIYATSNERPQMSATTAIPLDSIKKIEVLEFAKGHTTLIQATGITIGVGGLVAIIAATIASASYGSCPYISVFDGERYVVQGESYGGAIYPSLERADFMPLQARAVDGVYQLRISNELQEVQHTNEARLMVIHHDKNVRALADEDGRVYTISDPVTPSRAVLSGGQDVVASLSAMDGCLYSFTDTTASDPSNSVVLHFTKPAKAQNARLVLHAKNSLSVDRLYEDLGKALGSYYAEWVDGQKRLPPSVIWQRMQKQHLPLTVSLKTKEGWKKVRDLKNIGPLAFRQLVVPLDLEAVEGTDLQVKLSTGFLFWDLDYAGVDYSAPGRFTVQTLSPFYARDEQGRDVLASLLYTDQRYLDQPQPGNATILKFRTDRVERASGASTVILKTQGYYEHVGSYKGVPNLSLLHKLRQPGGFSAFVRQQYVKAHEGNRSLAITQ